MMRKLRARDSQDALGQTRRLLPAPPPVNSGTIVLQQDGQSVNVKVELGAGGSGNIWDALGRPPLSLVAIAPPVLSGLVVSCVSCLVFYRAAVVGRRPASRPPSLPFAYLDLLALFLSPVLHARIVLSCAPDTSRRVSCLLCRACHVSCALRLMLRQTVPSLAHCKASVGGARVSSSQLTAVCVVAGAMKQRIIDALGSNGGDINALAGINVVQQGSVDGACLERVSFSPISRIAVRRRFEYRSRAAVPCRVARQPWVT